jgi:hypothetical protein
MRPKPELIDGDKSMNTKVQAIHWSRISPVRRSHIPEALGPPTKPLIRRYFELKTLMLEFMH